MKLVVQYVFVKVIKQNILILQHIHGHDNVIQVDFRIQMVRYGLMDVVNVYVIEVTNYVHLYHVQLLNVHNLFFYLIDVVLHVQVRFY